jgi:ATP-binding cassette subfamily B protein
MMRPALRGEGSAVAGAVGCTVALVALELLRPWPVKLALDALLANQDATGLGPAALLVLAIALSAGLVQLARTALSARTGRRITARVRARVFEHVLRLPWSTQRTLPLGDLLTRIGGDVTMVRDLLFTTWVGALERVLIIVGTGVVLFVLDPLFAVLVLAPLVPFLILVQLSSVRLRRLVRRQREGESAAAVHATESLRQFPLVKSLGAEAQLALHFRRQARNAEKSGARAAMLAARMGLAAELLTGAGLAALLWFGGQAVASVNFDVSLLVVLVSYARSIYKPLRGLSKEGTRLSKATACSERLQELLEQPREDLAAGLEAPAQAQTIETRALAHLHDGTRGLSAADTILRPNELTVVTGPNGSGKSTYVALVLRLLPLHSGTILLDGQDATQFSLRSWRNRTAYVPQDIQLFGMSVRENLLLARPEATTAEMEHALALTHALEFVRDLPEGLDTALGEGGSGLSGGESRRLMLARAALMDAALVVLDEPLTGIDAAARPSVIAAVRALAKGRSVLVVTHESIPELHADQILHFADGRIAARWQRSAN